MLENVYTKLASHMSGLAIGPPNNDYLVKILQESLSPEEAEILLTLPTGIPPFEPVALNEITMHIDCSEHELKLILDKLAAQGMLFKGNDGHGKKGYALHQFGYGMPQAIFWPNEDTVYARKMAELSMKHSSPEVLIQAFGGPDSKVYRWIPINKSVEFNKQSVLPYASLETVIAKTTAIAVVNCNCRVMSRLKGRAPCKYPLDVCMKYDDLAQYVIDVGIGRLVSKDEAMAINLKAEEAGCVHFADNVMEGEIKHACNCCPCCCWSLGNLSRRRIPRDLLMACQFIRATDYDNCTGCGACVDACPVKAVEMNDERPNVDNDWCIGCGVCTMSCPSGAISMVRREDIEKPLSDFKTLSQRRLLEKVEL
ncbi:MAG: 4Fe-4S binding protein [Deltaproteobacteria bacterium]|nr:4Fe-4S binding protein [Deltaproteobacteria bacterium]MBW2085458.1 4Fe-4S binding protein [Deltaproteobacteria bacterium]